MLLLSALFIISGAAGLIYETVWTRYLGLLVGHGAYAQVLVLVIFLGGMAAGAAIVGTNSRRLPHPLLMYAGVELLLGVLGALFHPAFTTISATAYNRWFPAVGPGTLMILIKWGIAGALILPQSILLGTTFPLMTSGALRLRSLETGHTLGLLYFANSVGAAGGVILEGFVLIGSVGLRGTLFTAALLNLLVACGILATQRFRPRMIVLATPPTPATVATSASAPSALLWRAFLAVAFGTALSSFFYEIGWIRMLSLVLGSATHSFELMLSSFILGLALGAFWIRRRTTMSSRPIRLLGIIQWTMGVLAVATFPVYLLSFHAMSLLLDTVHHNDWGYRLFSIACYTVSLAVMLPATFCAGMTLPIIMRTLLDDGLGEQAVGLVYAMNTLGSIVGAAIAGLVLMPLIGLKGILVTGAVIDIAIGVALVLWDDRRQPRAVVSRAFAHVRLEPSIAGALGMTTAFVCGIAYLAPFDQSVLSSGVYRRGYTAAPGSNEFLYYRDGRTATVSLRRITGDTTGLLTLATNGKPDASVEADWKKPVDPAAPKTPLGDEMGTQILLPLITLAHRPQARRAAVIGEGSGMTSHILLGSPTLESLETIEIEPEMIRASHGFYPANRRVFDDQRSHFVIDDARSFLAASDQSYDLILSEPSNPWVSGVSGLFDVEFYTRIRAQLAPHGVLGQWLHLYEIDDQLVESVLAAIDRVFPAYDVYMTSNRDILILATTDSVVPTPDWSVTTYPALQNDLARLVPVLPEHFAAMRAAGRSVLHPLLAQGIVPNSDFTPVLDLGTERTRFQHLIASGLRDLSESRFDLAAAIDGQQRGFGTSPDSPATEIERVDGLAGGAALRAAIRADTLEARLTADRAMHGAFQRYTTFVRELRADTVPSDWHRWATEFTAVEGALDRGTAGVADSGFYSAVGAFVGRVHAPEPVVASVDFTHGMASWDFDEVNRASGILITHCVAGDEWLPFETLRDGAVLGHLMKGDTTQARAAYQELTPVYEEQPSMRDWIVAALVGIRQQM